MAMGAQTGKIMALVALWAGLATTSACPVCNTETGQQVRAGIGEKFGSNVLIVIAPVPLLLLSAYGISNWLGKESPTNE